MNKASFKTAAWILADWAGSAWPTVIKTFIFAAYFSNTYSSNPEAGTIAWCNMLSISGLILAITSPMAGILADQKRQEHLWYTLLTVICIGCSSLLWYAHPSLIRQNLLLLILGVGTFCYELSTIFYNSLLVRISQHDSVSKISSMGRGFGFLGGLFCLYIALKFFVEPSALNDSWFNFSTHENIRAIGFLVALWMLLFSIPAFIGLYQKPDLTYQKTDIKKGFKHYLQLKTYLKNRPALTRFLIISMIYTDGLNTLFATAGIFAMNTFHLSMQEMLIFAIACNVAAAIGSIAFSWLTEQWGALYMIKVSLISMSLFGIGFVCSTSTVVFYFFALTLTLFIGPLQSATRTYLIENTEPSEANTVFSLSALSGKVTAFAGPLTISVATSFTNSSRVGLAAIVLFFLASLYLLTDSKPMGLKENQKSPI